MLSTDRQQSVLNLLKDLRSLDPLKRLFWSELNYERVNNPLSRRGWPEAEAQALAEDPILFAGGGMNEDFHVICARLSSDRLLQGPQRPIVTRLLKDHPYSLFIFSNRGQTHWHFVNVKYDDQVEKRRLFRRITVGPGEHLRTAAERLALIDLDLLNKQQRDMFGASPLAVQQRHDEAFDVEAVTKKFFEQYHQVFKQVEASIEGLPDPETKRLFTQRLFNRLMFIAFIQKKGWLKFNGETDYLYALWKAYKRDDFANENFYNDRLKQLFFVGLNTPHEVNVVGITKRGVLTDIIGDIPYLNGGLFEQDEDDLNPDVRVPDEALGAILYQLFERFNFTVTESTPLDVEVAVDPEMLGKVFEELVTGRHESGSYYTPKGIVAFMCKEALKGYLKTKLPNELPKELEEFVDEHDPVGLRDPEAVLDALKTVRVCDPACGSGAYLLGMLHELLDLRATLFATRHVDSISTYHRKLEIIQNNLYGVDTDEFAVNIARLRLWLSLSVDFEGDNPPPLPNLDFKIEVGDSVTGPAPSVEAENDLIRYALINDYFRLKAEYLNSHGSEKRTLRDQINAVRKEIATWSETKYGGDGFDWQVEFAEVFANGGFDIIVANPPYVRQEKIRELKPALQKAHPTVYAGTADLYVYFYSRALQLLKPGGMLTFISSNKWFRANYGTSLRKHMAEIAHVYSITDFGDLPVFESATAYPMVFVAQQGGQPNGQTIYTQVDSLESPYPDVLAIIRERGHLLPPHAIAGSNWALTDAESFGHSERMKNVGTSLLDYVKGQIFYGIKTGLNQAFVIDDARRSELLRTNPKSEEILKPLLMGRDIKKWVTTARGKWLIVTKIGVNIGRYPAILAHLTQWQPELERRWDKGEHWWELRACAYYDSFNKPKIVFPDIAPEPRFAFDLDGAYLGNTGYIIPVDDLYLLGVLNSAAVEAFYLELGAQVRGGYLRFIRQYVEQIPVPNAPAADRANIAALVQKCLEAKGVGCEAWEQEINERVAYLYGLNTDLTASATGGQ